MSDSLIQINSYAEGQGEIGTKASGFAEGGPYSCNNCVWMIHEDNEDVCSHPVVNADPELAQLKNDMGHVRVDFDDCCRFVRPPKSEEEIGDKILAVFFRHGQTVANADNKFRGFSDFELDDAGIQDANVSGEIMRDT